MTDQAADATVVTGDQRPVLAALSRIAAWSALEPGPREPIRRIDTHGAIVFLAGDRVAKLKRAVRFPYMDFGTLERRRAMCAAEVAVNRRLAPDLYLGIAPVLPAGGEGFVFGAARDPDTTDGDDVRAVEWAVIMRRFDEETLFARLAETGGLTSGLMAALTDSVAAFHDKAPIDFGFATVEGYLDSVEADIARMRDNAGLLDPATTEKLAEAMRSALATSGDLVRRRSQHGAVRRVHGDLHLRNVCLVDGRPTPFDAIEFSDRIATIDVLYDLAFLLMDLEWRGRGDLANAALNHYLWRADGPRGATHLEALALMPLWLARRACIRAHVDAAASRLSGDAEVMRRVGIEARSYQAAALGFTRPTSAGLVAVGGLSGTGKTTLAMALAPSLGLAPGAVVIRSDVERKRLAGVAWDRRLPPDSYVPEASTRTYAELRRRADVALRAGRTVVVDAVFARPGERFEMEAVASSHGAPFAGIWLEVRPDTARVRVGGRGGDASDATAAVVDRQLGYDTGAIAWPRLATDRDVADIATDARLLLASAGIRPRTA